MCCKVLHIQMIHIKTFIEITLKTCPLFNLKMSFATLQLIHNDMLMTLIKVIIVIHLCIQF